MDNFYLEHHGVKGMKWGVRRKRKDRYVTVSRANTNARVAASKARKASIQEDRDNGVTGVGSFRKSQIKAAKAAGKARTDSLEADRAYNKQLRAQRKVAKAEKKAAKDPVKSMSDNELRQKINRLQMEKQYAQLTKKDTSAGQKFVSDILKGAAKQTAQTYVSRAMTKGVDKAIEALLKKSA